MVGKFYVLSRKCREADNCWITSARLQDGVRDEEALLSTIPTATRDVLNCCFGDM